MKNAEINADRFMGFADVYDNARPSLPVHFMELIRLYLGRDIGTVVDLGCGTGLSTAAWKGNCGKVIGIEPSSDMAGRRPGEIRGGCGIPTGVFPRHRTAGRLRGRSRVLAVLPLDGAGFHAEGG